MLKLITIVGATGNTGLPLLRFLSNPSSPTTSQFTIRATTRDPTSASTKYGPYFPNVSFVAVDANAEDDNLLDAALEGAEELVLLKPFFPKDYGAAYVQRWVEGVKRGGSVKRVHLLSGLGGLSMLRGDGWTANMVTISEKPLIESDLDYTIVRPPFFHTNAFMWAAEIKSHDRLSMPWGYNRFCAISPEDIAASFYQLLKEGLQKNSKRIVQITTNELLDGPTVTSAFSRALGRPISYDSVSVEEYIKRQVELGTPEGAAKFSGDLMKAMQTGDYEFTMADLKTLTGRNGVSFEQWAFENVEAFR
ncbi:hypothetical protein HK097_000376 [Rhizophlyctis rosea]|uniref:NmrA-like domain-containing protein n=1 Tax=Rhizophlyctis rosea TaxID=64517 RepID=A0AAD5SJG6_9FUNG|nr:hypothetical protein HK097_000376 [Rhizophlyctis rosea]